MLQNVTKIIWNSLASRNRRLPVGHAAVAECFGSLSALQLEVVLMSGQSFHPCTEGAAKVLDEGIILCPVEGVLRQDKKEMALLQYYPPRLNLVNSDRSKKLPLR